MPTAISLTPDESNLALASFKVEASSQLKIRTDNCSHQHHEGVTKTKGNCFFCEEKKCKWIVQIDDLPAKASKMPQKRNNSHSLDVNTN